MEKDARSFGEMRGLLAQIATCDMDADDHLRELRERYTVTPPDHERHVIWQELCASPLNIDSADDLDRFVGDLKKKLTGYLAEDNITRLIIQ